MSLLLSHEIAGILSTAFLTTKMIHRIGLAMDAWMWPLKDEPELAKSVGQPLLFINSEAFQTAANLETMKRFTVDATDHAERRVVTLKFVYSISLSNRSNSPIDWHFYISIYFV